MNIEQLRKYCLSFPHATEDVKWGNDLCFCVGGKMFCVTGLAFFATALFAVGLAFSALLKIRDEGMVRSKAIHIALGARADGRKEVLGLWIEQTEGAKLWLKGVNDLKTRGANDILVDCCTGMLSSFAPFRMRAA